jgi:hypothetical protein
LLLSLVAESLTNSPNLRILPATSWEKVEEIMAEESADTIIYDFTCISETRMLPLLYRNPNLLLIGLDDETNRAVHLTGFETRPLTLERVKEIILSREISVIE